MRLGGFSMNRIVITVKDEVGVIADISHALAEADINIEGLNTEIAGEKGVVILTTPESDRALQVLKNAGFRAVTDEAMVLRLRDEPGALARVAEKFKRAGVNIRSMHILDHHEGHATVALTADDQARAKTLVENEVIL